MLVIITIINFKNRSSESVFTRRNESMSPRRNNSPLVAGRRFVSPTWERSTQEPMASSNCDVIQATSVGATTERVPTRALPSRKRSCVNCSWCGWSCRECCVSTHPSGTSRNNSSWHRNHSRHQVNSLRYCVYRFKFWLATVAHRSLSSQRLTYFVICYIFLVFQIPLNHTFPSNVLFPKQ